MHGCCIYEQVEEQIDKINEQILIVKKKLLDKSDQLKEELTDKLDILSQAKKCGIVHIFECRRGDTNFKKKLIEQFQNIGENEKVLLMSNSLRDFFITRPPNDEYPKLIFDMLKKNVKFNILMLDPTSNAARSRAWVEERRRIEKGGYINSTLFKDIKLVADRLRDPSAWIDDELAKRIKAQIEVRFYPYDPTTFMIRTDKYTFIEQYHRGGMKE